MKKPVSKVEEKPKPPNKILSQKSPHIILPDNWNTIKKSKKCNTPDTKPVTKSLNTDDQ